MRDRPRTPLLVSAEVQGTAKLLTEREMATCSGLGFESLNSPELLARWKALRELLDQPGQLEAANLLSIGRVMREVAARLLAFPEFKTLGHSAADAFGFVKFAQRCAVGAFHKKGSLPQYSSAKPDYYVRECKVARAPGLSSLS